MIYNYERDNAYPRPCFHCNEPVLAGTGRAFLKGDKPDGSADWRAFHEACRDSEPFTDRVGPAGPVAAKGAAALAKADATAETAEQAAERAKALEEFFAAEALEAHFSKALQDSVTAIGLEVSAAFHAIVPGMIAEGIRHARPIAIQIADRPAVTIQRHHKALPHVLTAVVAGAAPFLVGPAGSGKTTLAEQVAEAMALPFYMAARVTSEYKLVGFVDAQGRTTRTQFRDAYENGGVFLFDEVDASDPDALTAFNAALANGLGDFPDGMVRRHKDFHAIAAGNTFGRGADRQYVGRNQLDAATLDRFQTFEIDYDEQLEIELAGNPEWTAWCQKVRAACAAEKVRHIVSPRASISGAKLLAAGMERAMVEEACVWKGLDTAQRARVMGAVR